MATETHLPDRGEMIAHINAQYAKDAPVVLKPFDQTDPDPLATLAEARRASFNIIAQCLIETQLINIDYALRAYMNLAARGVENPWAQVVASTTDQAIDTFVADAHVAHDKLGVPNIPAEGISGAARPIQGVGDALANDTLIKLLRGGAPLRENLKIGQGMINYEDGPKPADETTPSVEALLAVPGNAQQMQSLFQTATQRVLEGARGQRTNFLIGLTTAARKHSTDSDARAAARLQLQVRYGTQVSPILDDVARTFPGLNDSQRALFPALTRVVRVNPPPPQG